ncbi:unnamed protein product [Diplocarpon coronariae]|nr:hypothetical protein JHW43_007790 [Diplocarpon mali]
MSGRESSKRSVSGMTSLLPFRLLSPKLPPSSIWPSSRSDQRSTFGTGRIPRDQERQQRQQPPARVALGQKSSNNHLDLSLTELSPHDQHFRDTPVYNEPGSPCPGRSFYAEKDGCLAGSPPGPDFGGQCSLHDYNHLRESGKNHEGTGDESSSQSNAAAGHELSPHSCASDTTYTSRSSVLSFQCSGLSGEKLFPDEGAWLSSPLPDSQNSSNRRRSSARRSDHHVHSWLNDTSETDVGEDVDTDILAQATILSPSRAHLVRLNRYHMPGNSKLPSSCPRPYHVDARYSCASSDDSPPDVTTGEWGFSGNRSVRKELPPLHEPQRILPRRPFDLGIASPPISPKVFPDPPRFSSTMSAGIEGSQDSQDLNLPSRFSYASTISEPKSNIDIISDLEGAILRFPSAMLVPATPCIEAIRLNLAISWSRPSMRPQTCSPTTTTKNFSLPRRPPALKTSQSSPAVYATFWRSYSGAPTLDGQTSACHDSYISQSHPSLSISPTAHSHEKPPSVDLEALHRIFPASTEFTRLALYAHILAYIFVTSLPSISTLACSGSENVAKRRRDMPYWPISPITSKPADFNYTSSPSLQIRINALRTNIRKCIFRLLNNMDSSLPIPSMNSEFGSAELVLRSVSEAVQLCEELAFSGRNS